jgi:uncharacterized protein GlcG (DUF336 family)
MGNRPRVELLESRCMLSGNQLTAQEVFNIIEAAAKVALPSQTIVVVDRNGDVLGMYGQDPGSAADSVASNASPAALTEALTQDTAAKYAVIQATARARTAAYFESMGDAFTSRTARFIIQQDFPPGIDNTEAGPLLGVEFSNALGSDAVPPGLTSGIAAGLSGDPGGIPLFMKVNGQNVPVGAIGVAGDGSDIAAMQSLVPATPGTPAYFSDPSGKFYNGKEESDYDEAVALAGAKGFMAPSSIQANQIFINGIRLPFTAESAATKVPSTKSLVLTNTGLQTEKAADLPAQVFFSYMPLIGDASYLDNLGNAADGLAPLAAGQAVEPTPPLNIHGQYDATLPGSLQAGETIGGIPPASIYPEIPLTLSNGQQMTVYLNNNSPAVGGYGVDSGVPSGTAGVIPATVSGGMVTSTTAQPFGFTAGAVTTDGAFLSISDILQIVTQALDQAKVTRAAIREPASLAAQVYIAITDTEGNILAVVSNTDATNFSFDVAVQKARTAAFFSSDTYAFSSRTVGFLADAEFPPAIGGGVAGPLYDLQNTLALPGYQGMFDGNPLLGNGITIFPGGAPLYEKNSEGDPILVGAIGVSGDGVDQDDLIAYAGTAGFRPPANIEADSLSSSTLVTDITDSVDKISADFGEINPLTGASSPSNSFPTISQLILDGFDDPDSPNRDKIKIAAGDTIITRILKRLAAKGVDGVHLPYQKFPRNPDL